MTPEELSKLREEFEQYAGPPAMQEGDLDTVTMCKALGKSASRTRDIMGRIAKEQPDKYTLLIVQDGEVRKSVLRPVKAA
jgi:hypothetical protein